MSAEEEEVEREPERPWTLLDKYAAGLCVVMTVYLVIQVLRWLV